ncbi:MAG: nickel-dependent lactate racemase [Anaerolineales bacterium]
MTYTKVSLPYGHGSLPVEIPTGRLLGSFSPEARAVTDDEESLLREALEAPIGTPRLRDLAHAGQRVVIVTSDLTRPCPSARLLPPILEELAAAGISDEEITVVVALGLHRPMTPEELEAAVGTEVWERVQVINHDPSLTRRLGFTSAGTPVDIFAPVIDADLRVCLGNLEFHYFAGFSGGAKAILPGCASADAVRANHAMMVRPTAIAGRIEDNPVRRDLEEGVALLGVDFILNVLVDGEHRVVGAVAGDVTAAHRRGCELVAERGALSIPRLADLVLVSAGGYPKDVNLYQAQKALDNAAHAVRPGGTILLVAECSEGLGNTTFERWLREASSPEEILARIGKEFVLGGHKAAAIAAVRKRAAIYLVSNLPADPVENVGIRVFDDLVRATAEALSELGAEAQVLLLPEGGSILPQLADI